MPTTPEVTAAVKAAFGLGLEVNLDRKKRTLYNCQRIENYADTYDAHYRAKSCGVL